MPRDPGARTRLLDAADRMLASHGFRRMTVALVAAVAGVGKGSVYLHFASKNELALACLDRMAERVQKHMRELASSSRDARSRLRAMLRARVLDRFDYASRHAPSIDQKLAVMRQAMLKRRERHFATEAELLAGVLAEARFHHVPGRAADSLVIATNALLPYSLSTRELGQRARLVTRLDALLDLLLHALSPVLTAGRKPQSTRRTR